MVVEESYDGVADAGKPEVGGVDLADGYPKGFGGIVGSTDGGLDGLKVAVNGHQEVHVERVDAHATIYIYVGRGKEIVYLRHVESRLFLDFAPHALLYRLAHVNKATGQVESAACGVLGPTHHQHLVVVVDDECCRGRARIGIVGEAAVATLLALEIVDLKAGTAADRTEAEFL